MASQPFITCLWFDAQAEDAARFYTSVFKNSSLGAISRYTEAGPGAPGDVMTVEFELNGQKFLGLNGGPIYTPNEAFSLMIPCADQAEIDYYWDALTADGGQPNVCGWLKDKYGYSWQVIPDKMPEWLGDPDEDRRARVSQVVFTMTKPDYAALENAYRGGQALSGN